MTNQSNDKWSMNLLLFALVNDNHNIFWYQSLLLALHKYNKFDNVDPLSSNFHFIYISKQVNSTPIQKKTRFEGNTLELLNSRLPICTCRSNKQTSRMLCSIKCNTEKSPRSYLLCLGRFEGFFNMPASVLYRRFVLRSKPTHSQFCGAAFAFFLRMGSLVGWSHWEDVDAMFAIDCVDWEDP